MMILVGFGSIGHFSTQLHGRVQQERFSRRVGLDYRPESDVRPSKKKASTAASSRKQPDLIFTALLLLPIQSIQSSSVRLPPLAVRSTSAQAAYQLDA